MLLELVIDPTCSIVLERQPAERDIMDRPPRDPKEKLLTAATLTKSVLQGLAIFGASFGMYFYYLNQYPENPAVARTIGLTILFFSNGLLVQVNSSAKELMFRTFIRQIRDKVMWAVILGTMIGLGVMLYTPLHEFLKLAPLSPLQLLSSAGISCLAVLWYELVKAVRKYR